ncbi:MAG: hypothetical protein MJ016_00430 [Victivallaceae bacterium]|nr:hypothetical protein [Victivallaceae bacterium]
MKKITIFAILSVCAGFFALGAAEPAVSDTGNYESIMLTIWEDSQLYQQDTPTYGVKLGILGCGGASVYGAEGAVIAASSREVCGFKGTLAYTSGEKLSGAALAPVNLVKKVNGVTLAVVNVADEGGIQIGVLNFMKNGFLPCFPIFNFAW